MSTVTNNTRKMAYIAIFQPYHSIDVCGFRFGADFLQAGFFHPTYLDWFGSPWFEEFMPFFLSALFCRLLLQWKIHHPWLGCLWMVAYLFFILSLALIWRKSDCEKTCLQASLVGWLAWLWGCWCSTISTLYNVLPLPIWCWKNFRCWQLPLWYSITF